MIPGGAPAGYAGYAAIETRNMIKFNTLKKKPKVYNIALLSAVLILCLAVSSPSLCEVQAWASS